MQDQQAKMSATPTSGSEGEEINLDAAQEAELNQREEAAH
jgi:hypothetical protein